MKKLIYGIFAIVIIVGVIIGTIIFNMEPSEQEIYDYLRTVFKQEQDYNPTGYDIKDKTVCENSGDVTTQDINCSIKWDTVKGLMAASETKTTATNENITSTKTNNYYVVKSDNNFWYLEDNNGVKTKQSVGGNFVADANYKNGVDLCGTNHTAAIDAKNLAVNYLKKYSTFGKFEAFRSEHNEQNPNNKIVCNFDYDINNNYVLRITTYDGDNDNSVVIIRARNNKIVSIETTEKTKVGNETTIMTNKITVKYGLQKFSSFTSVQIAEYL